MQTRIPLPLLAVIALLTALLPGCAQDDPEAEAGVEVEDITDDAEDANPYFDPVSLIGEEVTVSGEVSDYLGGGVPDLRGRVRRHRPARGVGRRHRTGRGPAGAGHR